MIGNDIIDLSIALSSKKSQNLRFLKKIFTSDEIIEIEKSNNPELLLWQFWSMKEAVYKAYQRNTGSVRKLNPTSYHCSLGPNSTAGTIQINKKIFSISTEINSVYIHSYTSSIDFLKKVYLPNSNSRDELLEQMASELMLNKKDLCINKDENGIPSLDIKLREKRLPFSLSHHGKFTAFIIPLIKS